MAAVLSHIKDGLLHAIGQGEPLHDLLRKATSKTLNKPDDATNAQVVEMINSQLAAGTDSKEVVAQLKERLKLDNPHKQCLAIALVQKIMAECPNIGHTDELLLEVAHIMLRPAKPETDAAQDARRAAKELLRVFGKAGANAYRAVSNHTSSSGNLLPGHTSNIWGDTVDEKTAQLETAKGLVAKARSDAELLRESLSKRPDDFEADLAEHLQHDVKDLKLRLHVEVEKLKALQGEDVELVVMHALEAIDLIEGVQAQMKQ